MPRRSPGRRLILPGPALDGASLYDLMTAERVNSSWGVPTVWLGLQAEIDRRGAPPPALRQVVIGGSAAPRAMIEGFESIGIGVCHAWGMTEMSPVGTHGILSPAMAAAPVEDQMRLKSTQGRRIFGCEIKITDEAGTPLPHDGASVGALYVRGPAIASGYFNNPEASDAAWDADGWFSTGDVACIDPQGFMTLQDRAKDLIKSGGEWISRLTSRTTSSPTRRSPIAP